MISSKTSRFPMLALRSGVRCSGTHGSSQRRYLTAATRPRLPQGASAFFVSRTLVGLPPRVWRRSTAILAKGQREEAVAAQRDFVAAASEIQGLTVKTKPNVAAMLAGYAALTPERTDSAATIGAFFEKAGERLQTVKRTLNQQAYDELGALAALPVPPAQLISRSSTALKGMTKRSAGAHNSTPSWRTERS
jgi:hypothetical protein